MWIMVKNGFLSRSTEFFKNNDLMEKLEVFFVVEKSNPHMRGETIKQQHSQTPL